MCCKSTRKKKITVQSNLFNDHHWDPKKVAVVDRWSLFRVYLCNENFNLDLKMMVVIDRWSLFGGGRLLRFDCISKENLKFLIIRNCVFVNKIEKDKV
jgi:hypothetical protein